MNDQMITPYSVAPPQHDLDDLQRRLIGTRWPDVVPLRSEWPGVRQTPSSSIQLYRESFQTEFMAQKLSLPVAVSLFPRELFHPPKQWGERMYSQLIYWDNPRAGGHFAALEQPRIVVEELRRAFAQVR